MGLRVSLAGRLRLELGGTEVDDVGTGRLGRLALGYLVIERHRPVSRDQLAEVLWGEDVPRSWETSLRVVVSKLRAMLVAAGLPRTSLVTAPGSYQLHLPPDTEVDTELAADGVATAEAALADGRYPEAARAASEVALVASHPFLVGAVGWWAERRQADLRELRLRALGVLGDARLAAGDPSAALAAAEEAVTLEPFRESAHRRVIAAHAAAGNRAEGLRAYQRCRQLLGEELGVVPSPEIEALHDRLVLDEAPLVPAALGGEAARSPLPLALAPTSFVGRQRELAEVTRLLGTTRLLTLTGTGGMGKTRLAMQVAAGEGAHLVELAPLADQHLVPNQVLATLGRREEPGRDPLRALVGAVGDRSLLLVLDNCEHVIAAAASVAAALLAGCPGVRLLATSREPLGVAGETTWRVPSLATPPTSAVDAGAVAGYEAAVLFVERARAARPDIELGPAGWAAVAQICRRLDGIPLALELAAARTRALSVPEIADRLDDVFRLLVGGARTAPARHRTLRAAVEWTFDAVPADEVTLFERLAVFAGGVDLAAVERVCAGGPVPAEDVLGLLAGLVDRSLVLAEMREDGTRYRLLEPLRQFGQERLAATADAGAAVRDGHLAWATGLAERADRQLGGPGQAARLDTLEAAHDDLRVALRRAVETDPPAALRLCGALGRFWEVRGHLTEGRAWLDAALVASPTGATKERARALERSGILAQQQGDYVVARSCYEAGLAVQRELGQDRGVAAGLHGLGNLAILTGDLAGARDLYGESLAIGRASDDQQVIAASLTNLGAVAQNQGDLATAGTLFDEALAVRRDLGDDHDIALLLGNLAWLAFQEGALVRATELGEESLAMRRHLGDRAGTANALCNLGAVALARGDRDGARRLLEASLQVAEEVGDRQATTLALLRLARLARAEGDLDLAAGFERQALALTAQLGAKRTIAECLEAAAATARARGHLEGAARLFGAADGLREAIGAPVPPSERAGRDGDVALVRAGLSRPAFDAAWTSGRSLPADRAVAEAMASATGPGRSATSGAAPPR